MNQLLAQQDRGPKNSQRRKVNPHLRTHYQDLSLKNKAKVTKAASQRYLPYSKENTYNQKFLLKFLKKTKRQSK